MGALKALGQTSTPVCCVGLCYCDALVMMAPLDTPASPKAGLCAGSWAKQGTDSFSGLQELYYCNFTSTNEPYFIPSQAI